MTQLAQQASADHEACEADVDGEKCRVASLVGSRDTMVRESGGIADLEQDVLRYLLNHISVQSTLRPRYLRPSDWHWS